MALKDQAAQANPAPQSNEALIQRSLSQKLKLFCPRFPGTHEIITIPHQPEGTNSYSCFSSLF